MTKRITVQLRKSKKMSRPKPKKTTPVGQLIRALGTAGGGYVGGMFGAPALGSAAGNQLGAMASKWLGFGDYAVTKNSIITKSADSIPSMHKEDQTIVLRHKEFVGPLVSSTAFTVQKELPLNPGMGSAFPWLATIASRFQEYKFRGVVFHYIPASGSAVASTNSALGTIMFQTSYRASDTAPLSKVEMLNEYCANEVVPSESVIHPIECDPKQNPFAIQYVRSVPVPTGESILNYDLGRTFIATQGQQADGNYLGDVWVTYEVELVKPVYSSPVVMDPQSTADFVGAYNTNYFTTPTSIVDNLGLIFSGKTITFPAGCGNRFQVVLKFQGATCSSCSWSGASVTNGTLTFTRTTNVSSGSAEVMIACAFTKTDGTQKSILTLPGITYTGTIDITNCNVARLS